MKAIRGWGISLACAFLVACGMVDPGVLPVSVANTNHPLVAEVKFSAPCQGEAMVEFGPDTSYGRNTAWYPVSPAAQPSSILVAGMRATTTYHMQAQVTCSSSRFVSRDFSFTTGPLPANPFPTFRVSRPNPSLQSLENPGIELINVTAPLTNVMQTLFTDRDGNPIWFYDVGQNNSPFPLKLLPNGNVLIMIDEPTSSLLREVDLTGKTIREMEDARLAAKVTAAGFDFVPAFYHHDMLPLANGHVLVLVAIIRPFTNLPGYPGTVEVMGDGIVDLDQNWNPVWAWNAFDYLDLNRHLNGLPDWTHANGLEYLPSDGNLLLSLRHQSWVLKIDYSNGSGTGTVVWRLGYQGDFALADAEDPSMWFAFQHFPSLVSQNGSETRLAIWDNGESRVLDNGATSCTIPSLLQCYSRATIFDVHERARVADLLWSNDPGLFSVWGGSIQQLENGNVEFDINAIGPVPDPNLAAEVQEVTQTANPQIVWKMEITPTIMYAYRAYRVPSLYPGVTWRY
jgi:arylsulfate sulfotransferase